ncbi:MAG: lipid-A-disaccharide synthase [Deltaproteobacteria bacterium]|nr:lipid-A-disaccharide synthase [Deltaproteobacteria bacterium]
MGKSIFIISGEESGDMHGAALMRALRGIMPGLAVRGMGGERMRKEGLMGLDSKAVSVVGITEVIGRFPAILRAFNALVKDAASTRPDAVVLIDFPDFNLRFAVKAKKLGIPVIYYISPQVWAWRKGRIKKIAALVDKMLVVFPFEEALYRNEGVQVEYVGHPLKDIAVSALSTLDARRSMSIAPHAKVIALLPGSRTSEVERHLPVMLRAAEMIDQGLGEKCIFLIPAASGIEDSLINGFLEERQTQARVLRGGLYTALRASDAAIVASGTATLETALIGTPMVIIYKVSALSYSIGKALIDMEFYGLPNIVAGRKIVEELIQSEAAPEAISSEILQILKDIKKRNDIIQSYDAVRERLGSGAAEKAAKAIAMLIS